VLTAHSFVSNTGPRKLQFRDCETCRELRVQIGSCLAGRFRHWACRLRGSVDCGGTALHKTQHGCLSLRGTGRRTSNSGRALRPVQPRRTAAGGRAQRRVARQELRQLLRRCHGRLCPACEQVTALSVRAQPCASSHERIRRVQPGALAKLAVSIPPAGAQDVATPPTVALLRLMHCYRCRCS